MHDFLIVRYGGELVAEEICRDENIIIRAGDLRGVAKGIFLQGKTNKAILLEKSLPEIERYFTLWHELYHYFARLHRRYEPFEPEERHANFFAALCCCPHVDMISMIISVAEQNNVPYKIAELRLSYEFINLFKKDIIAEQQTIAG